MDLLVRQWIDAVIVGSPVASALGVELSHIEPDEVEVRLPYQSRLTTAPGTIHGGVISTLVDITGAAASASGVDVSGGATGGATVHLATHFLAPGRTDLLARGLVVHRTGSTSLCDVSIRDASGGLVATGQVSSRIFH
jgi:uncharacterized protein (TIGR00369 family)